MAKKESSNKDEKPTKSTVTIPPDLNKQINEYIGETGQTKQGFFIWLAKSFFKQRDKMKESNG